MGRYGAKKKWSREIPTKATTRMRVIMWRTFSGPRLSNLPKSPEPGARESPFPLDWSMIRMLRSALIHMSAHTKFCIILMFEKSAIDSIENTKNNNRDCKVNPPFDRISNSSYIKKGDDLLKE